MRSNTEKSTLHPLRFAALRAVQPAQLRLVSHGAGRQNQLGKTGRSSGPMGACGSRADKPAAQLPFGQSTCGMTQLEPRDAFAAKKSPSLN